MVRRIRQANVPCWQRRDGEQRHVEEDVFWRQDGTSFPVGYSCTPQRNDAGEISGAVVAFRDITQRKRMEEVLRQSEQQHRTLIETTATGFVVVDGHGNVLDANAEYVRLTGHHKFADIAGRCVTEWTAPHDLERNAAAVQHCFEEGSIRNLEVDYVNPLGNVTPIEINASAVRHGEAVEIVALCRDITSRRHMEDALHLAVDAAESATRAKSDFLATMSHEIRTPLNGVIGTIGLLLESELTPRQRELAAITRTSCDALLNVINDVLDFSKIEAGKMTLEPVPFNLLTALEEVGEMFAPASAAKQLEIILHYPPARRIASSATPAAFARSSPTSSTPSSSPTAAIVVSVECMATRRPAHLRVLVEDTGID